MKIWFNNVIDTQRRVVEASGNRVRIGRAAHNEIVLESPYIADEAAVLYRRNGIWELVVLGINGAKVGEKQLYNGDRCEIRTNKSIGLFPFNLTLDLPKQQELTQETRRAELDELMSTSIGQIHLALLQRMNIDGDSSQQRENDEYLVELERNIFKIAESNGLFNTDRAELVGHMAGHGIRDEMLSKDRTGTSGGEVQVDSILIGDRHWSRLLTSVPEREQELESAISYIAKTLKLDEGSSSASYVENVDREFWVAWEAVGNQFHTDFRKYLAARYLKKQIKDIVFGYGPLEDLLRLPTVSEIMVVDRDHVYVERNGMLENSGKRFISNEIIETIIQRIVGRVSRRIDKSQPLVDARLSDGSRVNAVIPPLAVSGPTLTIRKFPYRKMLIDDLVNRGAMTRTVAEFLRAMVLGRKNIVISGGTGTGKTTLLNCLSDFIPDNERIVTIEDTAELQLAKEHLVRLETKEANVEGAGEYAIRDLVRNALRMRPDRIVVGECRGPEALDMLQAMNTGHDGSLTTIHANSAADVLLRLEVLVQMAADLPVSSIHQQIGSAVDIIVQLERLRDGRRVISQITECTSVNPYTQQLELRDIYLREKTDDELLPTGLLPTFVGDLIQAGTLDLESFFYKAG